MKSDRPRKNTAAVPTTRLASAMSFAPTHCATMMVEAMKKPNITPNSRNITTLALPAAAKAASPRYLPTQIAFTEPLTDCNRLPRRIGSEKTSKARGIEPSVSETSDFTKTLTCEAPRNSTGIISRNPPRGPCMNASERDD
jgi:hypothetical protein